MISQNFIANFCYISFLFLLSKMSIGPNFILCTRNVIRYGYRTFFSNLAYVFASLFWMVVTMFTFAFFSKHQLMKSLFAIFGSFYIFRVAFSCLRKVKIDDFSLHTNHSNIKPEKKSNFKIFLEGLWVSISNPETMIFYSQILNLIEDYHGLTYKVLTFYIFDFLTITFIYFNLLAILLNQFSHFLKKYQRYIMIVFAIFLSNVAIKIIYKNALILQKII